MNENFISEITLKKISLGDHIAFREFYDMTYNTVYRFISYFLQNKEDCEETVSEVYYIIWKQREGLMEIVDFKSWLYVVCRNEAFHCVKQKNKYTNLLIDDIPIELFVDTTSVEGMMIEEEMLKIYDVAIAELPERCKLIFLMVREEGLRHKEIASILSITEGTIEQQMNIAIKKIVAVVRKYYPGIIRNGFKGFKNYSL